MKKLFVLFSISIYLISTTELSQLLKFPVLVEHYGEHKSKSPALTFLDFLELHYANHLVDHPHDEDYEQDQKLPFIVHSDILNVCFIVSSLSFFELKEGPLLDHGLKVTSFDHTFFENRFLSTIWEPPKFI